MKPLKKIVLAVALIALVAAGGTAFYVLNPRSQAVVESPDEQLLAKLDSAVAKAQESREKVRNLIASREQEAARVRGELAAMFREFDEATRAQIAEKLRAEDDQGFFNDAKYRRVLLKYREAQNIERSRAKLQDYADKMEAELVRAQSERDSLSRRLEEARVLGEGFDSEFDESAREMNNVLDSLAALADEAGTAGSATRLEPEDVVGSAPDLGYLDKLVSGEGVEEVPIPEQHADAGSAPTPVIEEVPEPTSKEAGDEFSKPNSGVQTQEQSQTQSQTQSSEGAFRIRGFGPFRLSSRLTRLAPRSGAIPMIAGSLLILSVFVAGVLCLVLLIVRLTGSSGSNPYRAPVQVFPQNSGVFPEWAVILVICAVGFSLGGPLGLFLGLFVWFLLHNRLAAAQLLGVFGVIFVLIPLAVVVVAAGIFLVAAAFF